MIVFLSISLYLVFELFYFLFHTDPLNREEIEKLSKKTKKEVY